ncbi:10103_t:CDS:2, partial [Racocetra persica]
DQRKSIAFMWNVPYDQKNYLNSWAVRICDGYKDASADLYADMIKNSHNGDGKSYRHNLDYYDWSYSG